MTRFAHDSPFICPILKDNLMSIIDEVRSSDGSAAMRFFPSINFVESYQDFKSENIFFGFGAGSAEKYFSSLYGYEKINLGFMPAFVHDYGLLGFVLGMLMM